jgi:hypothetical protein
MTTPLFTKDQLKRLPKLYETENTALKAKKVIVKLFHPSSSWTWYVIEYDGDDTCWGLVDGFELEYGYFALSELSQSIGPFGLSVERDKWFTPTTVGHVLASINKVAS